LIFALKNSSASEKKWVINVVKNHNEDKDKVDELIQFITNKGGLKYAEEKMYEYKNRAFDIIKTIEQTDAKTGLIDLVNYITERKY
ncbi:MAG TPA: polyprenyl synthetase family protein, partial [Chitinophagales bacterium]|nr:polyprenyl synthetase family protein [Chitinophagales bacterium]